MNSGNILPKKQTLSGVKAQSGESSELTDAENKGTHWVAPIARWSSWNPRVNDSEGPDVGFIEPMLRRRLSNLAKMSLRVAQECTAGIPNVRFVFSSRHGDLTRTASMLNDLAEGELLSPTTFSLSVLNASSGLFSILRGDTTPSTAISAAESSFGYGLLESAAQFAADPTTPVLYVYADEPAPSVFGAEATTPTNGHAVALLFSRESTINLKCRTEPSDQTQSTEPHSLLLLSSLIQKQAGEWHGEGKRWLWTI